MKILSLHTGHDAAAALYDGYTRLVIYKEERLSRVKQDGNRIPWLSLKAIAQHCDLSNVDVVTMSLTQFPIEVLRLPFYKKLQYILKMRDYIALNSYIKKYGGNPNHLIDNVKLFKKLGVNENAKLYIYNHHFAHAIPTLFYNKEWDNALLYSADGGGDFGYYGIYYFDGKTLTPLYEDKKDNVEMMNSVGLLYTAVTEVLGFKPNRHEGKITGLAAFGKESVAIKKFKKLYNVDEKGIIHSSMRSYKKDLLPYVAAVAKDVSREDLAYAVQTVLEELILKSIKKLHKRFGFSQIGLSGGVFSNVKLNQRISELSFIEDMFVFPPMGDEGLVIGGVMEYLIKQKGFENFLKNREKIMEIPYWGEEYVIEPEEIGEEFEIMATENIVEKSVELLEQKKICAIFTKGMEYGPRALGARSILIDPRDRSINDTVNKRLDRTEFMPFAPYVRYERVRDVFDFPDSSLKAMRYMTVTCDVKGRWREKIQATVHVDNTARPQTIKREDNSLYYDILYAFEKKTGVPCLVNTSFNAHEEPIINKPQEALQALRDDRVDYIITDTCIIGKKS